jgi:hypothetical protein
MGMFYKFALNIAVLMRRSTVFVIFFTLLFPKAQSQVFHAGIMAGVTICDVHRFDPIDRDNDFHKLGLAAGGLVNTKMGNSSLIQMELAYIMKGSSMSSDTSNNNQYYNLGLHYVDISILLKQAIKFKIKENTFDRLGVEAGLTAGTPVLTNFSIQGLSQDININKFDLELLAGIYYNVFSGFYLSLRYSNSIIHAIKHDSKAVNFYPYFTWQNGNNLVFQITFGFVFGSGKNGKKED